MSRLLAPPLGLVGIVALVLCASSCNRKTATGYAAGSLSAADSHERMVRLLAEIANRAEDENIFVGSRLARAKRAELKALSPATPKLKRWLATYQLAKAELLLGNEARSIGLMSEAMELIRDDPNEIKPEILQQFYFDTAVAYLRWGESQNCCRQQIPDSCIVPIRGSAIHTHQDGSRRGIEWLTALLKNTDSRQPMHLAARWLLNIAYMTLGEYPDSVPPEYRISGINDQSASEFKAWKNVANERGVATFSLAGGAIADDFDQDNDMDLVVSSSDPREPLRIFWNDGSGSFTDGTVTSNLSQILGGLNITQTDYNNDGLIDIFVMRGGWLGAAGQHPNSLLRNNGDGTFTDVTLSAGLDSRFPTQAAAWADFDLDGDLDVFIGNESTSDLKAPSQLYRNEGDGRFVEIAKQAGVTNDRLAKAVTWGDYNADRFPDLYVSNYRGANRLYRNRGNGRFEDVAAVSGVDGPDASFPTWFCDVNNDGNLDLFVAAYAGGIAEVAAHLLQQPLDRAATLPRLFVSDAQHRFTNQAEAYGLVQPTHPMGANFGDLDGDGFVDFYLGTGWPELHELMPNKLYHNRHGSSFQDVTNAARVGHLQKGHAVVMADFDNDGDIDLFEQMGGFVPADRFYDVLYENPGNGSQWLKLKLEGRASNRPGIGARIHVRVVEEQGERSIFRVVNSGGSFGANPLEQTIGLGDARRVSRLEVFWPRTGKTDTFTDVPINQRLKLIEGESTPVSL